MSAATTIRIPRASHRPAKSRAARHFLPPAVTTSAPADVVQLSVRGSVMHPRFLDKSSVSDVDYMLDCLSAAERGSVPQVRRAVAKRIGIAPGTVENLKRGRIKFVERVEGRIRAAFVTLLESEIARATHELKMVRRRAESGDCAAVRDAEIALRRRIAEAQALVAPVTGEAAE